MRTNPNYPNLPWNGNGFSPNPYFFDGNKAIPVSIAPPAVVVPIWRFPAPNNSSDFGIEGWLSFDKDYYYVHTSGEWKRIPIVMVYAFGNINSQIKWSFYDVDYIYVSGDLNRLPISLFNNF